MGFNATFNNISVISCTSRSVPYIGGIEPIISHRNLDDRKWRSDYAWTEKCAFWLTQWEPFPATHCDWDRVYCVYQVIIIWNVAHKLCYIGVRCKTKKPEDTSLFLSNLRGLRISHGAHGLVTIYVNIILSMHKHKQGRTLIFFFSSPNVSYCHHLASVVVRRKLFQKSSLFLFKMAEGLNGIRPG